LFGTTGALEVWNTPALNIKALIVVVLFRACFLCRSIGVLWVVVIKVNVVVKDRRSTLQETQHRVNPNLSYKNYKFQVQSSGLDVWGAGGLEGRVANISSDIFWIEALHLIFGSEEVIEIDWVSRGLVHK
jgi:hypothetical protein